MYAVLGFCGWMLWFMLVRLGDKLTGSALATIAVSIIALIAAIVGSDVFGAAWEAKIKSLNDTWGSGQ